MPASESEVLVGRRVAGLFIQVRQLQSYVALVRFLHRHVFGKHAGDGRSPSRLELCRCLFFAQALGSGRRAEFESFVFAVVATFLASYVSYILAPAFGPREPAFEHTPTRPRDGRKGKAGGR